MTATSSPKTQALLYSPYPKQRIFHLCPAQEVFYGGAAGPGKSYALINHLIRACIEVPGIRTVFFRRKFRDLEETIADSKDLIPKGLATYNENDTMWTFAPRFNPNPDLATGEPRPQPMTSYLHFAHLVNDEAIRNHYGFEYDIMAFDESTHFTTKMLDELPIRNRTTVPGMVGREQIVYGSNPGNVSHVRFRQMFVKPPDEDVELVAFWSDDITGPDGLPGGWMRYPRGTRGTPRDLTEQRTHVVWRPNPPEDSEEDDDPPRTRAYIRALLADNHSPGFAKRYRAILNSIPNENLKRALRDGEWDIFEGQFFEEFRPAIHVIDPIAPEKHWRKWRGLDWGFGKPLACLWFTQNPDTDQIITYRELAGAGLTDGKACELIKAMTPQDEHIDMTLADPSMWSGDSRDDALSRAAIYERNKVLLTPANNRRVDGWARMRDALAMNTKTGEPNWVITRNCRYLIETLPTLKYDDNNKEDLDTEGDDHAADAARYALLSRSAFTKRRTSPMKHGVRR